MRPNPMDPEARHLLNARKTERDNEWLRRQIGDATYLRSLMILGYGDRDARTELAHLRFDRVTRDARQQGE